MDQHCDTLRRRNTRSFPSLSRESSAFLIIDAEECKRNRPTRLRVVPLFGISYTCRYTGNNKDADEQSVPTGYCFRIWQLISILFSADSIPKCAYFMSVSMATKRYEIILITRDMKLF